MKQRWYCSSTIIRQRLSSSQQQQQQLFVKQNNVNQQYQSFSIKSMKSYGPVLKEGPPSYRKVLRDRYYRFNKRIVYEQNHLQYDVNEFQNKLATNEKSTDSDEPIWLIRFQNAQLQYPMTSSSSSLAPSSSSSFVTKKHQQAKEAALRRRQRLLERKQQQQLQLRSKRRTNNDSNRSSNHNNINPNPIFYINQLEIRANMKQNQLRSRNARYGTGHVLLGRNGCGKSLLLHSILHSYTSMMSSITQQQQKEQVCLKEMNIQSAADSLTETIQISTRDDSIREEITSELPSPTRLSVADTSIQQQQQSGVGRQETATQEENNQQHEGRQPQRLDVDVNTTNPYLVDPSKLQLQGIPNQSNTAITVQRNIPTPTTTTFPTIAYVSFESHQELLDMGGTVWSILTKSNSSGGQLTKGMQYLIVRFGLYPLLTRDVTTLSTGEIRKVMIINAVAQQPHLLILDNAFDGLDAPSRKVLKDIIIKTLNGFQKSDTLVQGINSKDVTNNHRNTQHYTQVLLVTHRHEEICDEISRVTYLHPPKMGLPISTERRLNRNSKELLYESAGQELMEFDISTIGQFARKDNMTGLHIEPWFDETLPTEEEILLFWNNRDTPSPSSSSSDETVTPRETIQKGQLIVHSKHFHISRDDKDLISDLNWKMNYGERWWLSGLNGAGKSTLSKYLITLLLQQQAVSSPTGKSRADNNDESFLRIHLQSNEVNYVSTERHLSLSKSNDTGLNIIRKLSISDKHIDNPPPSREIIHQVMKWLRLPKQLLLRPFNQISQGEQKMLLIAGIISFRPSLIILDEALQGLDIKNRHRVMGVVDRICSTTEISIIYVTHHYEDLIPSLTHALHLNEGKAVFKGNVETFDGHNTLWSDKIKFVPESERERNEDGTFKIKDIKKRRTRRVW